MDEWNLDRDFDLSRLIPSYFSIHISPDNMVAECTLNPRTTGVKLKDEMPILILLRSLGVRFGIIPGNLKEFMDALSRPSSVSETIVLARGRPPEPVNDARVVFMFDDPVSEVKNLGRLNPDEMKEVFFNEILIPAGGVIAALHVTDSGRPGITVRRQEIPPLPGTGSRYVFNRGIEEVTKDDHIEYIAKIDGIPVVSENTVNQVPVRVIETNLFISRGTDEYKTHLFVNGNISGDGLLKVEGNLYVLGRILGTSLDVSGNIIVTDRILGNRKTGISCCGNMSVGQVEGAEINAEGLVIVREAIFNSVVVADMGVEVVDGNGAIVGGDISGGWIRARRAGSSRGIRTILRVREKSRYRNELNEIRSVINELLNNITLVERYVSALQQNIPKNQILARKQQRQIEEMLQKRKELMQEMQFAKVREERFSECMEKVGRLSIEITGKIYPGVEVDFNGEKTQILDEKDGVKITGPDRIIETGAAEEVGNEKR